MTGQSLRQAARRDARTVASKRRAELLERSRRLEKLAVTVMTAVAERDQCVAKAEREAGEALREMTAGEGLTLREALKWCGDSIDIHEATRLRKAMSAREPDAVRQRTEPRRARDVDDTQRDQR